MGKKKDDKEEPQEEKRPVDMTTDETLEHLFGEEGAEQLREAVRKIDSPPDKDDCES